MLNNNGDYTEDDDDGFSHRAQDIEEALGCLDAAVVALSREKVTHGIIGATELIIRAMNLIDRSYAEEEEPACDDDLDFNDSSKEG